MVILFTPMTFTFKNMDGERLLTNTIFFKFLVKCVSAYACFGIPLITFCLELILPIQIQLLCRLNLSESADVFCRPKHAKDKMFVLFMQGFFDRPLKNNSRNNSLARYILSMSSQGFAKLYSYIHTTDETKN